MSTLKPVYRFVQISHHHFRQYMLHFATVNTHSVIDMQLWVTAPLMQFNLRSWICRMSYVYCTVDHLDSWIKIAQLDVTCFIISLFNAQHVSNVSTFIFTFNAQHVSNVSTSIFRSLRLICWVISWVVLIWFDVCWCYGVVRLGWSGILMQAEAKLQPA